MSHRFIALCAGLLWLTSSLAEASPQPLTLDMNLRPHASKSYIRAAHQPIEYIGGSKKARLAILQAMLEAPKMSWSLEGEGDGYVRARFDYRGDMILIAIEYDEHLIQIRYLDGYGDFVCENNVDGICYDNHSHYYSYTKRLRKTIELVLARTKK